MAIMGFDDIDDCSPCDFPLIVLLQGVSALLLFGFGVSQYRMNRIRVSDLWLTTRPAVAWLVRMTITGAGVWLVVDGNGNGWMWMQNGGAIYSYESDVTLSSCSISYNTITSSTSVSCLVVGGAA